MNLEKTLKKVSKKIWNELKPINDSNVSIHSVREEALSSMGLKILAKSKCSNVLRIEMISANEESLRGYDYEICIGVLKKESLFDFLFKQKGCMGIN